MSGEIDSKRLFDDFVYTLDQCGNHIYEEDDLHMGTALFEEFDIGLYYSLYEPNMQILLENNYVTQKIVELSRTLRKKGIDMQKNDEWHFEDVRTSKKWKELFDLSDEIKALVMEHNKNTDNLV